MAAINPWASWGALTDQSWGMTAVDPWASWGTSDLQGRGRGLHPRRVGAAGPCSEDPVP
ncbi:zinc finger protein 606 [Homo sapiens]|uniref:Zinc finger protein 606 n=2 Tax=Hominidae TaxID=9604 RepID=F8VZG6_HUMAN|nr:zinc finger protein 606 [Homo sapiens]KAI4045257.1 zinc finger protein 606 [Homo sapiens]PNJ10724.1 ZNF606 isoform 2 [Pongo abelii]